MMTCGGDLIKRLLLLCSWIAAIAKGACRDKHSECASYARRGWCKTRPFSVLPHCPKSCQVCTVSCIDKNKWCQSWVSYCWTNSAVLDQCRKTCGICSCCLTTTTSAPTSETPVTKPSRSTRRVSLTSTWATAQQATSNSRPPKSKPSTLTTECPSNVSTSRNVKANMSSTPMTDLNHEKSYTSLTIIAVSTVSALAAILTVLVVLWFWKKRQRRFLPPKNSPMTDTGARVDLGSSDATPEKERESGDGGLGRSNENADTTSDPIYDYSRAEGFIRQIRPANTAGVQQTMLRSRDSNIYEDPRDQFEVRFQVGRYFEEQDRNRDELKISSEGGPTYFVLEGPDSSSTVRIEVETENPHGYQSLTNRPSVRYQPLQKPLQKNMRNAQQEHMASQPGRRPKLASVSNFEHNI